MSDINTPASSNNNKQVSGWILFYIIISIGMAGFIAIFGWGGIRAGFIARFIAFIVGSALAYFGTIIGDWLRKIAMPDAFWSSGMGDTLKKKLFWFIGPQVIGCFIGALFGVAIIIKIAK